MLPKSLAIFLFSVSTIGICSASESNTEAIQPEINEESTNDSLNFSGEGLEIVIKEDGTKTIDLQGRFAMSSVIKPMPDGSVAHICTGHPERLSTDEHNALHSVSQTK